MNSTRPADVPSDYLLARVGRRIWGIPARSVRRIVASRPIFPVPGSKPPLVGLTRLGGEPVAVLSLESLATGAPAEWKTKSPIIFVQLAGSDRPETVGLVVSQPLDVKKISEDMWQVATNGESTSVENDFDMHPSHPFCKLENGRIVFRLDLEGLRTDEVLPGGSSEQ